MGISNIHTYLIFKSLSDYEPLLITKRELLEHWDSIKKRSFLTEVEYLTLFANTSEDIIPTVTKELFSGIIEDMNAGNINENDEINSYIQVSLTVFECLDFTKLFL